LGRRAQVVSLDLMASILISILLLTYYIILWDSYVERHAAAFGKGARDGGLLAASDSLVLSGGYPENWPEDPSKVLMLGLARTPNILDPEKVSALEWVPYATAKRALGTDQEVYISVEDADGIRYAQFGTQANSTETASETSRTAMLNGTVVHVRVQIYEGN